MTGKKAGRRGRRWETEFGGRFESGDGELVVLGVDGRSTTFL
jgi:hypothetical protein